MRKLRGMRRSLPQHDPLFLTIAVAKKKEPAGRALWVSSMQLPEAGQPARRETLQLALDRTKLPDAQWRDGHDLLRSNLIAEAPAVLWPRSVQLTPIETVLRSLKSALEIRPLCHRLAHRVEAHIFLVFLAYGQQVRWKHRAMVHAPGLMPTAVLEKLAAIQ